MKVKKVKTKSDDKDKPIIIAEKIIIPKTREGRQESDEEGLEKEAALVMIVTTPPNKESRSRKRKREVEEGSPSAEVVSEASLEETAPMVLASWKTAAYKDNSTTRRLAEVMAEMEAAPGSRTEEVFKD